MTSPSTWGGRTVEARRAARRERLIDAAIDIWADSGWAAVSLRSVCGRAGLNDRYFRESFADREELLAAAWDHVRDGTTATLIAAIGARRDSPPLDVLHRAVEAVVLGFAEDPRRSQVLFGDHAFPGLNVQQKAVEHGVRFSGCTVHFVNEECDEGPIIIQAVVPVFVDDTGAALAARILEQEHRIYPRAIQLYAEGRLKVVGRKVLVDRPSKDDAQALIQPPLER
jgi:AcrR family transcriptional regulator